VVRFQYAHKDHWHAAVMQPQSPYTISAIPARNALLIRLPSIHITDI
jgi:hypothetical protein